MYLCSSQHEKGTTRQNNNFELINNKIKLKLQAAIDGFMIYDHTSPCIAGRSLHLPIMTVSGVIDEGGEQGEGCKGDFTPLLL